MPAITSGKVLVTGANGYIAVWIVKLLLDAGFSVRGTVRSDSKATHLRALFRPFGDKFEVVIVPDMTNDDAFAPYVKDVAAIVHTASPFHMTAVEPDEIIAPAVAGTLSVLKAAHAHGPAVRRVLVLSSTAALFRAASTPTLLDEFAWNEQAVTEVREKGRDAAPVSKYRASKTLAERAAWDWYAAHRDGGALAWDLTVLNPPFVYGPGLNEVDAPEHLSQSVRDWYFNVVRGRLDDDALANSGAMYVDVRDLAQAHVLALRKPEAGGERIIISAGAYKWQDFVSAAHRVSDKIPAGNTSYDPSQAQHLLKYDNSKGIKLLDITYRSIDELTNDALADFTTRGWL